MSVTNSSPTTEIETTPTSETERTPTSEIETTPMTETETTPMSEIESTSTSEINFSFNQEEINGFLAGADPLHNLLVSIVPAKYYEGDKTNLFLAVQFSDPVSHAPIPNAIMPKGCPNPPGWRKDTPQIDPRQLINLPKFIILAADKMKLVNGGAPSDAQVDASVVPFDDAGTQQVKLSFPSILDAMLL